MGSAFLTFCISHPIIKIIRTSCELRRSSNYSKVAGVAGFEPTNDGVRGTLKTQKMAKNSRKTL